MRRASIVALLCALSACTQSPTVAPASAQDSRPAGGGYLDNTGRDDVLSGGVKMIPVTTPKGTFHVWTKRIGNNPTVKVLLLTAGQA